MMTEDEPKVVVARRYTEANAARVLGVHRHTMERWRKEGRARCKLSPNGRIYYTGLELLRIWNTN